MIWKIENKTYGAHVCWCTTTFSYPMDLMDLMVLVGLMGLMCLMDQNSQGSGLRLGISEYPHFYEREKLQTQEELVSTDFIQKKWSWAPNALWNDATPTWARLFPELVISFRSAMLALCLEGRQWWVEFIERAWSLCPLHKDCLWFKLRLQ